MIKGDHLTEFESNKGRWIKPEARRDRLRSNLGVPQARADRALPTRLKNSINEVAKLQQDATRPCRMWPPGKTKTLPA